MKKIRVLIILLLATLLLECSAHVSCTLGAHTGERYYFNVKVIDSSGLVIEGAKVYEVYQPSIDFSPEEFFVKVKGTPKEEHSTFITDSKGEAQPVTFYLGCLSGPISSISNSFKGGDYYPMPTSIYIYKRGFVPVVIKNVHETIFTKKGREFFSDTLEVQLNAINQSSATKNSLLGFASLHILANNF